MCDGDYDTSNGFDSRKWRRARKAHRCYACREEIRRGDRYHATTSVWERGDKPSTIKHCARCWLICEALWAAGANGIDFELNCGEVWDDNFDPTDNPEPVRLAFMTKDEAQKAVAEKTEAA